MFTTEMNFDETKITLLDNADFHEDVIFCIYDDCVIIRQWDVHINNYAEIIMSPDMFDEFTAALNKPEGAFRIEKTK